MIISCEQIMPKLSSQLRRLMDDVLAKSNGSRTLEFSDALEHKKYLTDEKNACIISGKNKSIIVVKQLDPITDKEELAIAHELGHLWLLSHNFPRERQYDLPAEQERQERYDICFGPLPRRAFIIVCEFDGIL